MRPSPSAAKAVVLAYVSGVTDKDFDSLPDLFAQGATWWVSGNPERVAKAGTTLAVEHLPALPGLINNFDEYEYRLVDMVGERNTVMAETQAEGSTNDGIHYVNNITVTFEVNRDGKISSVREYPVHNEIQWLLSQLQNRTAPAGAR